MVSQTRGADDPELCLPLAYVLDDASLELDLGASAGRNDADPHRAARQSRDRLGKFRRPRQEHVVLALEHQDDGSHVVGAAGLVAPRPARRAQGGDRSGSDDREDRRPHQATIVTYVTGARARRD
jgi:hypothetical protein